MSHLDRINGLARLRLSLSLSERCATVTKRLGRASDSAQRHRPLRRRSGRSPALPYPPRRQGQV